MAYGKIKADSIIYDDSGSDVDTTIASLVAPKEGTAIKSTGETGTTKFLRTDGDGTCSWIVPPDTNTQLSTEQVQDIVGAMVTGNTETGITVTYEDGDGTLDFVIGTLNQNTTGTAAEATNVTTTANNSTDETVYPTFVDGATGTQGIETDTGLTYNPSTGLLSTAAVTTTGNVVVGGDLTVSGTTTTVSSTTIEVADKNIELGKVSSPDDTTADGGGITLKGATDKEIKWVNSTDAWTFNQNIAQTLTADGGITATAAGNHAIKIIGDANRSADGNTLLSLHGKWNGTNVATIDIQAGDDTTNKDNGQIVFYTAAAGSQAVALTIAEDKSATFTGTITDPKGELRAIPQNTQGSTYTLVAADHGKHILASGNITVPDSVFTAGQAVTIVNNTAGNLTISKGTNMYWAADGTSANRTLGTRGVCTLLFTAADTSYISGSGLT